MANAEHSSALLTARQAGMVACLHCGRVWERNQARCGQCGAKLSSRYPQSLQRVWAWWVAGLIAYIPANLYPMMITDTIAHKSSATIIEGVGELMHYHAYFVAGVVFFASVMIPTAKFLAIAYVAVAIRRARKKDEHMLHKLYEVVEFIGRWSMIDVFVVAILSALVHLGSVRIFFPVSLQSVSRLP